jgi:hypothetical protein
MVTFTHKCSVQFADSANSHLHSVMSGFIFCSRSPGLQLELEDVTKTDLVQCTSLSVRLRHPFLGVKATAGNHESSRGEVRYT